MTCNFFDLFLMESIHCSNKQNVKYQIPLMTKIYLDINYHVYIYNKIFIKNRVEQVGPC